MDSASLLPPRWEPLGKYIREGVFKILLQIPLMSCSLTCSWRGWAAEVGGWKTHLAYPFPLEIYPGKEAAAICI